METTKPKTADCPGRTIEDCNLIQLLKEIRDEKGVALEKAVARLRNNHLKKLTVHLVYKMGGHGESVASGVTDTFLIIWKKLKAGTLNPEELLSPGAYLYEIARKKVIDHIRKDERRKGEANFTSLPPHVVHDLGFTPASHREGSDLGMIKSRWNICWRYFVQGESLTEIAESLSMDEAAIKKEILKGRKQAKKQLGNRKTDENLMCEWETEEESLSA